MSAPTKIPLSSLPRGELEALAERLLAENDALKQAVAELKAEVATLEGVKGRPEVKPSGMEKGAGSEPGATNRGRGGRGKADRLTVDEERVVEADVPAGSRFKGYEDFLVQDLVLRPHVVRVRRERWLTPDGRTVLAPMPAGVVGHFGPALRRFVLAQYHQGQVTVPRLLAQLRAIGILISKRQVVRLLNAGQDAFLAEAREVLRAGLATAGWVSVDDTGARHRHRNGVCTQLGNDHFAAFVTTASKSRLNFLEVLRAGFAAAEERHARLLVVHAWRPSGPYDAAIGGRVAAEAWQRQTEPAVWELVAGWRGDFPAVEVEVDVRYQRVVVALAETTRHADVLVMGRRGERAPFGLVLGSTARTMLRVAACPVEIVPAPAYEAGSASRADPEPGRIPHQLPRRPPDQVSGSAPGRVSS